MKRSLILWIFFAGILLQACEAQTPQQDTPATEEVQPAPAENPAPAPVEEAQPEVSFTDLNVEEFKAKMNDPNVVILDVRTPQETQMGVIEGAVEADVSNPLAFAESLSELDPDKTYLVYCRSGRRSVRACEKMIEHGFTDLYNLLGGYQAWEREK